MVRLSCYEAEIFSDNPHLQQDFANGREFIRLKREMRASDRSVRQGIDPPLPPAPQSPPTSYPHPTRSTTADPALVPGRAREVASAPGLPL